MFFSFKFNKTSQKPLRLMNSWSQISLTSFICDSRYSCRSFEAWDMENTLIQDSPSNASHHTYIDSDPKAFLELWSRRSSIGTNLEDSSQAPNVEAIDYDPVRPVRGSGPPKVFYGRFWRSLTRRAMQRFHEEARICI